MNYLKEEKEDLKRRADTAEKERDDLVEKYNEIEQENKMLIEEIAHIKGDQSQIIKLEHTPVLLERNDNIKQGGGDAGGKKKSQRFPSQIGPSKK
mmetsp:Transcript_3788/g.3237  ORF Transcript_3788/g.3237 Transcript_3788/m.3237 type:complete len:95 (+) Transcript_3788:1077-1361(+)